MAKPYEISTWTQNLKNLSVKEYQLLREMCRLSKCIYNQSLWNIRQVFDAEGSYLRYEANFHLMKDDENYLRLGGGIAQQAMRKADYACKSFFALKKLAKEGKYELRKINFPHYLPKDGFLEIVFTNPMAYFHDNKFKVPVSKVLKLEHSEKIFLKIPKPLQDKKIHQISIVPKCRGRYFEVRYMFESDTTVKPEVNQSKFLGIDLGIDNLATCVTDEGQSFIVDGKKLKSINQWYNKERTRLSSIKDTQGIKGDTRKLSLVTRKRNRRVKDYMLKSAKTIINYCIQHEIGNVVVGYNDGFQDSPNLGRVNNQKFTMIPLGQFKNRLEFLCKQNGIQFILQEESYTSKASFFDEDEMPEWTPRKPKEAVFSGKRIHRGLYQTKSGQVINADVNAALNILKKSKLADLSVLQCRGVVETPLRVRI